MMIFSYLIPTCAGIRRIVEKFPSAGKLFFWHLFPHNYLFLLNIFKLMISLQMIFFSTSSMSKHFFSSCSPAVYGFKVISPYICVIFPHFFDGHECLIQPLKKMPREMIIWSICKKKRHHEVPFDPTLRLMYCYQKSMFRLN